ncbi:MAG: hypothetical protein HDR86_00830 [Bacteroides sp.]|nr:hypothetical protein [Bacteroides sp.]
MNEEKQVCGYTEDYCSRGYGCVLLIAALVSLITSITALALCGVEDEHNNVGSSWAIGILGTLLTFAVAWSIWQVIDTKNTVRKAEETSKHIDELQRLVESTKSSYQSYVFYVDAVRDFDKGEYSSAFLNMASSLKTAIEYEISFSRFGRRALDLMDECLDKGQIGIGELPDMHIQMVEMLLRQVSKNADYLNLASIRLQKMKSQLEAMRK